MAAFTEEHALALLRRMVAYNRVPQLDDADLTLLLALAARPDSDGYAPSEDGWTPTWDLNFAAAEGWNWKAGAAAEDVTFRAGDLASYDDLMFRHCVAMADRYRRRQNGSMNVGAVLEGDPILAVNA